MDWETLTMEKTLWSMLVRQLEDLLLLQILVKLRPSNIGIVARPAWDTEPVKITVKRVMDGGRGNSLSFIIVGH